jgi:glycosyltransferase involved in cell wall biosynthesis
VIVTMLSVRGRVPAGGIMAVWEFAGELARRGHEVHLLHTTQLGDPVEGPEDIDWFTFDEQIHQWYCDPHQFRPARSDFVFCIVGGPPPHLGLPLMWVQAVDAFPVFAEKSIFGAPFPKLCTSSYLRDCALAKGVDPERAIHQPYGIRHEKYRVLRPIDDRPMTVVMLDSTNPLKGRTTGIAALVAARQRVPELRAVLFGIGERPDLPAWINYVEDPPQHELVEEIYNGSRVFVLPSDIEGFGLAAVEAMACGCALASTDNGGAQDYAFHGDTALVTPPGDADALAESIVELLTSDDRRIALAERGRSFVEGFDWERSTTRLEDFLRRYADDPGRLLGPEDLLAWPDDGIAWLA